MKALFFIISFFASYFCFSQTLPEEVARFYLEQNDRVKVLEKKVERQNEIIDNQAKQLIICQLQNTSFSGDEKINKDQLALKDERIKQKDVEIRDLNRKIKGQKFQKILIIAGAGAFLLLGL